MKLSIGIVVLAFLTIVKSEDCSRCASAMTTIFKASKTQEGYDGLAKVMHEAICKADQMSFSCQDQETAKKIDLALEDLALSPLEANLACHSLSGACESAWDEESCSNDVENFVFAHFKNKIIKSELMHIFKADFEALTQLHFGSQDKWEHDIETLVNVGFQAVFDNIKPNEVCDFLKVAKDKYEL